MIFFYVAKIFWLLFQPAHFLVLLLALAVLAYWSGRPRLAHRLTLGVTLAFIVIATLPVNIWVGLPIEDALPRLSAEPACIDGILVLGGGESIPISALRGIPTMPNHLQRLTEAARLLRLHPEAKLVFSGGSANAIVGRVTEADVARELFAGLGVDIDKVIFENRSRDTYENEIYSRELVHPADDEVWLLVTSAMHLPRATAIANTIGWHMLPWPTDYLTAMGENVNYVNFVERLGGMEQGVREWAGLIAYRLTGRTDSLFPQPFTPSTSQLAACRSRAAARGIALAADAHMPTAQP